MPSTKRKSNSDNASNKRSKKADLEKADLEADQFTDEEIMEMQKLYSRLRKDLGEGQSPFSGCFASCMEGVEDVETMFQEERESVIAYHANAGEHYTGNPSNVFKLNPNKFQTIKPEFYSNCKPLREPY